jgi:hypothetical protein
LEAEVTPIETPKDGACGLKGYESIVIFEKE